LLDGLLHLDRPDLDSGEMARREAGIQKRKHPASPPGVWSIWWAVQVSNL